MVEVDEARDQEEHSRSAPAGRKSHDPYHAIESHWYSFSGAGIGVIDSTSM